MPLSPPIDHLAPGAGLHELFAAIAKARGDAPAVSVLDIEPIPARREAVTYAALDARADAFSRHLARQGVRPGDRVALHLPRGLAQHWALLGVMKAGAAYVPVDWATPPARLAAILADCDARAVVGWGRAAEPPGPTPRVDLAAAGAEIADESGWGPAAPPGSVSPEDLAYIIYTSGSTGAPKGVMIRHRNIRHFVEAESAFLRLSPGDRVFGAFSLAFDMSIETMWTAWRAGAELICATEALARSPHDLPAALARGEVTVWHVTPSLLGAVEEETPSVTLINLGGEACPPALVRRWSRPGRRLVNTYGPTEASVTATAAELRPGEPVTIGRPLPGYRAWIVDEALTPLAGGQPGELVIGGAGVGAGYVNRPRLTARRFVAAPGLLGEAAAARGERVYRTGDRARVTPVGEIEFLGRADGQVKLRGYRVELEEIEAVLAEHPGVAQAAVTLVDGEGEAGWLAGHVVAKPGVDLEFADLRAELASRLPDYMRPRSLGLLDRLPVTASGKVDRAALPVPTASVHEDTPVEPPATPLESELLLAWSGAFADRRVGVEAHFFDDLGGHSLIAARMVSAARKRPGLSRLSIQDVYAAPTIRALAERVAGREAAAEAKTAAADSTTTPSSGRSRAASGRVVCVAAQTASLVALYGLYGVQWAFPYLVFSEVAATRGTLAGLGAAALVFAAAPSAFFAIAVLLKRAIVGKIEEGDYPLWGATYFRWWLGRRILALAPTEYLSGTPLLSLYVRLLGAKIGAGAFLATDFGDPDLVTIGAGAILSDGASLATAHVEDGVLRLRAVAVGARAFVGDMAVVGAGAVLADDSALDDLSALPPGARTSPGERWSGSPARPVGSAPAFAAPPQPGDARKAAVMAGLIASGWLLPLAALAPIAPGMIALSVFAPAASGFALIPYAPILALSYVVGMCLFTAAAKWTLLGRIRAGRYSIWSGFYVRYWFIERLNFMALGLLHSIFATLYVRPWYRLMGARMGRRCEISSASAVSHDLIDFGEESFIADGVSFGAARMEPGAVRLARTRVGRRTFIGNSALLPTGASVADGVLIGVLSRPPDGDAAKEAGVTWFGSPPLRLPNRPTASDYPDETLFRPTGRLIAIRLAIEYLRITLAPTLFLVLFFAMLGVFDQLLAMSAGLPWLIAALPAILLGFNLAAVATVVALKWLVIGRYQPRTAPLWSLFVWRTELVTSTYEALIADFLGALRGTPYINIILRLMGCRIGERVFTDTADITEFDLVRVGDDAALNADCGLQTHLFEDRVMKLGPIDVGARATVGQLSIVLYDGGLEDGARLGDLSVTMKGEVLPAGAAWEGSPAQAVVG